MNAAKESSRCVQTIEQARGVSFDLAGKRSEPTSILMCEPTYFDVKDSKNAFMDGQKGRVDCDLARQQWYALKSTYESCGYPVAVVPAVPDFEDMVFAANQALPGINEKIDGETSTPYVVRAKMAFASRNREIPYYLRWFEQHGYRILNLAEDDVIFEGQGDAIWHPGRQLLWLGYGNRTQERAGLLLAQLLAVDVLMLKLKTKKFYHLDTCFAALDKQTVLIYPPAFDEQSLLLIRHFFPITLEASESDALNFACNCVALKNNVVLQKGSAQTVNNLRAHGFTPREVDISEFMKSGGGTFCLKLLVY
jgi:N-dimethylarginine dimethylaminohydrolase